MKLCRVLGSVTQTAKHETYLGQKLMVVEPIDAAGRPVGSSWLAIDRVQAGPGDRVLVMAEGNGVRQLFGKEVLPIRSIIIAIVDAVDVTVAAAGGHVNERDRAEASPAEPRRA
jgi:ethanolamine utilization protein EutN